MGDDRAISTKISQLAARQYGHVTRRQLLALGLGAEAISYRLGVGRLIAVHVGVYAVGYRRVEPVARGAAAVLACGPTAVLSHDSAAALWGLRRWPRIPEVTVSGDRRPTAITVHRSRTLGPRDVTTQLGVRTTTAARTLHDLRSRLTARQLTRLVNAARLEHLLDADRAEAVLGHRRNPTRSGLEDAFQRFVERHGLPQPETNARLAGREIDALFAASGIIVELDDFATHGDRATFASDRERDVAHAGRGLQTIRLTADQLTAETAAILRRLLSARAAQRSLDASS